MSAFWGSILVILPLFVFPSKTPISPSVTKDVFFILSCLVSFCCFSKRECRSLLWLIPLIVLSTGRFDSLNYLYQSVCFLCGIGILSQMRSHRMSVDGFYQVACVMQSTIVLFQYFGVPIYDMVVAGLTGAVMMKTANYTSGVFGSLINENYTGLFIALTLPSLIDKKLLFSICLVALFMCNSIFPITAFFVGMVYYFCRLKNISFKWPLVGVLGVLSVACLASYFKLVTLLNSHGRYEIWIEIIRHAGLTLFGNGLGALGDAGLFYNTKMWYHAHNEYVDLYYAFGLAGIGALFYFINKIKTKILKGNKIHGWVVVTGMFSCIGAFAFHISSTALPIIISLAILIKDDNNDKAVDAKVNNRSGR